MKRYAFRRLLTLLPILFAVSVLSFGLLHLAGSDAVQEKMVRTGMVATADVLDRERAALGLDAPLPVQYARWLSRLAHGDFGVSYVTGTPVLSMFLGKLPATLLLATLSLALTVLIAVPCGILAAVRRNSAVDRALRALSFLGNSLPNFLVALLLLYLLAIRLRLFPVLPAPGDWRGVCLPALTLAIAMASKYIRQVRTLVLDALDAPFVAAANARGIPLQTTLLHSVLPVCFVPLLTLLALSAGSLLGGTAIVEDVFQWDGVGKMAIDAIHLRDYPVVQAYVLWMATLYTVGNLCADLLYRVLDPRIYQAEVRE